LRPFALACFLTSAGCAGDIDPEEAGGGAGGTTGSAGAQGGGGISGSQGAAGGPGGGAGTSANPTGGAAGVSGVSGTIGAGGGAVAGSGGRAGMGGSSGNGGSTGTAGTGGAGGRGGAPTGAGGSGGASTGGTGGGAPATFKVFDRIPQYGMYATRNPNNYTPPADVLMWSYGAYFVAKLSPAQRAAIGGDLAARITYHAQCDNYDRLGTLFFVLAPPGQPPKVTDPRTELARFITPFSDYTQGTLATYVFPNADISAFAATLASVGQDVWIGIGGGSNPYDGDPCTNANVTPDFRDVGFKYSLEMVSTKPLPAGAGTTITALNYFQATKVPVTGTLNNPGGELAGRVTVIVSGHGSEAGGDEYRYTQDTLSVGGMQLGSFSTQTNCASYEKYSPDGNPGIFRNNTSNNPRNWCPGALLPAHTFPVTLRSGSNAVSLAMSNAQLPSGSYYATSISFTAP
jgi:hypothetical protein